MPAIYSKNQPVFIGNVWDQVLFYFIHVDDFKPLVSPLDAVHAKLFHMLGIIQSFHSFDLPLLFMHTSNSNLLFIDKVMLTYILCEFFLFFQIYQIFGLMKFHGYIFFHDLCFFY